MDKCKMSTSNISNCPPKNGAIIIHPTECCNNKNCPTWSDIKNKPFQDIDRTFFSVDTKGNITLSKDLNNNICYLNVTVNEIKTDNTQLVNRLETVEKSIEFKDF